MTDQQYLHRAVKLAGRSEESVPCGCIIVLDDKIIAEEFSSQNTDQIAVHHAELKAVYQANRKTGTRKLSGATAYCSCEPCAMCVTALSYAKIERIVYNKTMADLFPDDPQSHFDTEAYVKQLNHVPKLEQLLL